MATPSKLDDFKQYYEDLTVKMLGPNSVQDKQLEFLQTKFEDFALSESARESILTQLILETNVQYNKDATNTALKLFEIESGFDLKAAQKDLVDRQKQGFDDNLLVKVSEHQSGLASFAVNANSSSAQDSINTLKTKLANIESRVIPLDGGTNCPVPIPVTPVPQNLAEVNFTHEFIRIEFDAVPLATSYGVYQDGVLVKTSGDLFYEVTGLNQLTKYSFNVRASIDNILSDLSDTIVVTTDIAPVE